MKLAERLAKFINKGDRNSADVGYWQNKYFSVWERHPRAIVEIEDRRIIYFNSKAERLLHPVSLDRGVWLKDIFERSDKVKPRASYPIILPIRESEKRVVVNVVLQLSRTNYFISLEPETTGGEPTPILNLKNATGLLCNSLNDGFLTCTLEGSIIYTNKAFKDLTKFIDKELDNRNLSEITPEKWHSQEEKILETVRQKRKIQIYRKEIFNREQDPIAVEVQAYPFILDNIILGFWFIIRELSHEYKQEGSKADLKKIIRANEELIEKNKELSSEIEEKKILTQQLLASENVFRNFIHQSAEGICLFDHEGTIIEWNDAMSKLYRTPRESYLHKPVWQFEYDFLPEEGKHDQTYHQLKSSTLDYIDSSSSKMTEDEQEKRIEGKTRFIQYRTFPIDTEKGRIFGLTNLDISERKAAEYELEDYKTHLEQQVEIRTRELLRSEAHLRLLIRATPMAYYSYPEGHRAKSWFSEHIEQLTGYSIEELSGDTGLWEKNINPEDFSLVRGTFDDMALNQHVACEYRWKTAGGNEIWIYDQATLIEDQENKTRQIVGCFLDITQRKQYEESIKESERSSRAIFNASRDAIFIFNADTKALEDVNDTMLKMYRISFENALKTKPGDLSLNKPPFDSKTFRNFFEVAREKGSQSFEWMAKSADNHVFWVEIDLSCINLNGAPKIMAVVRDINERKKAEALIQYRTDFEKLIFDISTRFINLPVNEVDAYIKVAFREIAEFTHTDVVYLFQYDDVANTLSLRYHWKNQKNRLRPDDLQNFDQSLIQWHSSYIRKGRELRIENSQDIPAEGKLLRELVISMNLQAFVDVPLFFQGEVIGFLGLGTGKADRKWIDDEVSLLQVTGQILINAIQRKESVQRLQESEQTHREIYNATRESIIVHDAGSGRILDVNEAMLDMFGVSYSEALNMNILDIGSGQNGYHGSMLQVLIEKTRKDGPQVIEWQARRKNGATFWVEISLKSAEIKGEKNILSVIRDITERKESQEILKENEEKYRLLIEGQSDLIVKLDTEKHFQFVSPSYCDMFDKTEDELIGKTFMPQVHEDDREQTTRAMDNLYRPPYSCYLEQRILTKTGWRWLAWSYKAMLNEDENITGITGVGRDITYQKGVEEALRRSEDRFRSIVQQLTDIVLIMNDESVIVYDTPSIQKVLGYEEGSLVGTRLIELVHPEDVNRAEERFGELVSNPGELVSTEIRVRNARNQYLPLETIGFNLLNHPSIKGLIVTLRDISERKQVEKMILDAVITTEENERERFAKNLHDDLGPLLSSIKMYINSLSSSTDAGKKEFIIQQLNEVIKEAIITTKEVSNDLSPHILINYGLVSAVETFLKKVPIDMKLSFDSDITTERYSNTIENSMYRIMKELINNTLKHAGASSISIRLFEKGQKLHMHYSDDGKGLDIELLKPGKHSGMGLSNIMSRARTLDGTFEFDTKPGKGFTFKISIPINQGMT